MDSNTFRSYFPPLRSRVHLASCSFAPRSTRMDVSLAEMLDALGVGSGPWPAYEEQLARARSSIALLLGARPEQLALMPNATMGAYQVASSFDWKTRPKIVTTDAEFPSIAHVWLAQRARGAEVVYIEDDVCNCIAMTVLGRARPAGNVELGALRWYLPFMSLRLRQGTLVASFIFFACGGAEPPSPGPVAPVQSSGAAVPPRPAHLVHEAAAETMAVESTRSTPKGTTFTVPAGWTLKGEGARQVLDGPEHDVRMAIAENEEASADAAVASAWASLHADFQRPLKLAVDEPARSGWEQKRRYIYEVSPNEKRYVRATARRSKRAWTVTIIDATLAGHNRRGAQIEIVDGSLSPRGYQPESFKGKTAHTLDRARIAELVRFIESARAQAGIPGIAISLVQGGKIIFEGGYGVRELGKPAPVDAKTLFIIASNTKALSTLLLAKEIDEGKFTWETPVVNVYPAFKLGDSETTPLVQMKHLVCACTGMPEQNEEWFMEFAHATAETEMQVLSAMRPTTKIGETYQYSNMLAAAAGFVGGYAAYPKRELGAAYDEAMRTRVFEPLGMKSTTFDYDRALRSNHATPHSEDVDGKVQVGTTAGNRAVVPIRPAAGAWSNAHDVALYVQMELANGKLPNGQRYVSEKNLLTRRERQSTPEPDVAYGMGLESNTRYGTPLIHHGGSMFGLKSDMFWLPEHDVGGVILINADSGRGVRDIYQRKVLEVLFDGKPEADEDLATYTKNRKDHIAQERTRLVVPAAEDAVAALAKRYVSPVLGEISVERKGRNTTFDFGEWKSTVASRKNDDGSISFFTIDPGVDNDELLVAQRDGKRALIINDRQMEYVFLEK